MDEVAQLSIFSKHAGCEDADDQGVVCDAALISIYGVQVYDRIGNLYHKKK